MGSARVRGPLEGRVLGFTSSVPFAGGPQPGCLPAACSPSGLHPGPLSGSHTRPSTCRGAPARALQGASPSGTAPADTWAPAGPEPSSRGWAVGWVPARCRASATACGSSSHHLARGTCPLWTPAVPTAMAKGGGRPYLCLFQLHAAPQSPTPAQPARAPTDSTSLTRSAGPLGVPTHPTMSPRPRGPALDRSPTTCTPGRPAGRERVPGAVPVQSRTLWRWPAA